MKHAPFVLLILFTTFGFAQKFNWNGSVEASGYLSSQDNLPFWMYANTNGAIGSETNGLFAGQLSGSYWLTESSSLEARASFFLRDEVRNEFQRDEIFVRFKNSWLKATLGSERPDDKFAGLGTVQEDFLLSGNARALPGIIVEASNPLKIAKNLSMDWGIAHYELTEDRYVVGAMLHYKRLGLFWKVAPRWEFRGTLTHYAQWGGVSPELGQQPESFSAFIDVFFARRGGDDANDSDQANAAGNHLGLYEFEVIHDLDYGLFKFYHQHPFEDGSGTRLKNFPDGIWGFMYEANQTKFSSVFKAFLIEYVQTTSQSGSTGDSGRDNYFRSGIYRSGWTFDANILGLPFITVDETGLEIANNKSQAIHLGFKVGENRWDFTTRLTFIENKGSNVLPLDPTEKAIYSYFKFGYGLKQYGKIELITGADFSDLTDDTYGGALRYVYSF